MQGALIPGALGQDKEEGESNFQQRNFGRSMRSRRPVGSGGLERHSDPLGLLSGKITGEDAGILIHTSLLRIPSPKCG